MPLSQNLLIFLLQVWAIAILFTLLISLFAWLLWYYCLQSCAELEVQDVENLMPGGPVNWKRWIGKREFEEVDQEEEEEEEGQEEEGRQG